MKILVYEFASGGGFAGRPIPASLGREGSAMASALVADLCAIRGVRVTTTIDERLRPPTRRGARVVTIAGDGGGALDDLVADADAVWLIAPERDRCLETLAARIARIGTRLLGPDAAAIRRASDKGALPRRLSARGVAHPHTQCVDAGPRGGRVAAAQGRRCTYPVVVKPRRGAGCEGVSLARNARELRRAVARSAKASAERAVVLQRYVAGVAASVSLIADGRGAIPLAVNAQLLRRGLGFSYRGGRTPLRHRLAAQACDAAVRACKAVGGLRGYVGVDVVLSEIEDRAVVIEINPRLTTSYLGVRAALRGNVAAMALAGCDGTLPDVPSIQRAVRFTSDGRISPW